MKLYQVNLSREVIRETASTKEVMELIYQQYQTILTLEAQAPLH